MTTVQNQEDHRILLDALIQLVQDGMAPEVVSAALHGAGIGSHLSADALVTIVADTAEAKCRTEDFRGPNGEAAAEQDATDRGRSLRSCDRRDYADALAIEQQFAWEWCLTHILGAGWARVAA